VTTADNTNAELIAAAKGYEADGEKYPGGYGWLINRLAAALAKSESELARARESSDDFSRRLAQAREQAVMNETRLQQKLTEQAATIERIRKMATEDDAGAWDAHQPLIALIAATPTSDAVRAIKAEAAREIAAKVRANCTPSSEAYSKGGDLLVYAVADWIENPPEWVKAPWAVTLSTETTTDGEN
jgi:hypothetical protein